MPDALNPCSRCNGSGTEPAQPGMDQIRAYMTATGWGPRPPGPAGEMWHREGWPHGIAVAFAGEPGSLECRSVITRLSWAEGRGEPEITADILGAIKNPENGGPDLMAATCTWCEEPMDGRPCIGKPLADTAVVEGVSYYRIPWGPPPDLHDDREFLGGTDPEQLASIRERWATWPEGFAANCRDCATPQGALHHPGCDTERCPRCLGQAISCGCKWEGDTADPDDDGFRDPESPYARRAP